MGIQWLQNDGAIHTVGDIKLDLMEINYHHVVICHSNMVKLRDMMDNSKSNLNSYRRPSLVDVERTRLDQI